MAFKLLSSKLPNELVDIVAKQLHVSFMKDLKEDIKRVNVWRRPTQYLVDMIGSTGTFQLDHYHNEYLEIYEEFGYISGNAVSPYLVNTVYMFQPLVDNAMLVSNNNPALTTEWEWYKIPRRHGQYDIDPYHNNDYFPDYSDEDEDDIDEFFDLNPMLI